jgi:hypothetical protein
MRTHPRQALTDDQACWALDKIKLRQMTQQQVAMHFSVSPMLISRLANGYSYPHLQNRAAGTPKTDGGVRHGLPETPERRFAREAGFWARVVRSGEFNACWPYRDAKPGGYGRFSTGKALVGSTIAHVIAHTLATGLAHAPGTTVDLRHLCDNKPCCNPAHLQPGTRSENLKDRWAATKEGRTGPRPVTSPVVPPAEGWKIAAGDLERLERVARISEFDAQVDRSGGEDACWPWLAKTHHKFGYGQMRWDGQRTVTSHRIAYLISNNLRLDELPPERKIRHRCPPGSPRSCSNPRHLLEGSQAENRADCIVDGTMPMGENHHMGKRFPDQLIRQMREEYYSLSLADRPTFTALAARYGAAITSVAGWLSGRSRAAAGGPTRNPQHAEQTVQETLFRLDE